MSADPHHQFRQRIDQLTDERDRFRERAALVPKLRERVRRLEKSLQLAQLRLQKQRTRR